MEGGGGQDIDARGLLQEANLRPDARTLLGHPWIRTNKKKNIRATWGRTQGNRVRGGESLYESVSSVVNRILQVSCACPVPWATSVAGHDLRPLLLVLHLLTLGLGSRLTQRAMKRKKPSCHPQGPMSREPRPAGLAG